MCTGREKEKSNRITEHFFLPFRVRSTTKNEREQKKSNKTKIATTMMKQLLTDVVSPEKKIMKKKEIKC